MKRIEGYEGFWDLHLKLPMNLVKKLDRFCEQYRRDSRAEGIRSLLDIAFLCTENWQKIQSPDIVDELHRQFQEGTIVDDIQKMDRKQFEVLYDIFRTERKTRGYSQQERLL